jgi:hypothetical protein
MASENRRVRKEKSPLLVTDAPALRFADSVSPRIHTQRLLVLSAFHARDQRAWVQLSFLSAYVFTNIGLEAAEFVDAPSEREHFPLARVRTRCRRAGEIERAITR